MLLNTLIVLYNCSKWFQLESIAIISGAIAGVNGRV